MRLFLFLWGICCTSLVFAASSESATVYKCADDEGNIAYQKSPCQHLDSAAEVNLKSGSHKVVVDEIQNQIDEDEENLSEQQKQALEKLRKQAEENRLIELSAEQAQKNQEYLKSNIGSFSPYALPPYQGKSYAGIVRNYLARLPEIERYRRVAASNVLLSGQCRRVEAAEMDRFSKLDNLNFIIDCRNGKRVKLNEKALKDQKAMPIPVVDDEFTYL
jgi:hypothetical protein